MLASVVIPASVESIGSVVFDGCLALTIYAAADSAPEGWDADWNSSLCRVVWEYNSEQPMPEE
jgi:hypothetical protein